MICKNCGKIRDKHDFNGKCLPRNRFRGKRFEEDTQSEAKE